jgi:hypothetical protein
MGKKLWLVTGGAIAAVIALVAVGVLVPSIEDKLLLAQFIVTIIWAGISISVLLADARRTHKIAVLTALAAGVGLSLFTSWFGFLALLLEYFGTVLFVATALVFGVLLMFRRRPRPRALLVALTMSLMGSSGVLLSAWSATPIPALPAQGMNIGDELKYIHDTDQSDRLNGYFMVDPARDRARLQRVKVLYREGTITEPMDQFNAAVVYQHATCADEFEVAYGLAKAAYEKGVDEGHPPLYELAYDRWQLALGKSQKYYTQMMPLPIKRPCPAGK